MCVEGDNGYFTIWFHKMTPDYRLTCIIASSGCRYLLAHVPRPVRGPCFADAGNYLCAACIRRLDPIWCTARSLNQSRDRSSNPGGYSRSIPRDDRRWPVPRPNNSRDRLYREANKRVTRQDWRLYGANYMFSRTVITAEIPFKKQSSSAKTMHLLFRDIAHNAGASAVRIKTCSTFGCADQPAGDLHAVFVVISPVIPAFHAAGSYSRMGVERGAGNFPIMKDGADQRFLPTASPPA